MFSEKGKTMHSFEKLTVWKRSCRLTVNLYKILKDCKDYGFKDQMTRAAVSIPSNIAEGYERRSPKEYLQFLSIAKGSSGELRTQLYIASELDIINRETALAMIKELKEISAMLQGIISKL